MSGRTAAIRASRLSPLTIDLEKIVSADCVRPQGRIFLSPGTLEVWPSKTASFVSSQEFSSRIRPIESHLRNCVPISSRAVRGCDHDSSLANRIPNFYATSFKLNVGDKTDCAAPSMKFRSSWMARAGMFQIRGSIGKNCGSCSTKPGNPHSSWWTVSSGPIPVRWRTISSARFRSRVGWGI